MVRNLGGMVGDIVNNLGQNQVALGGIGALMGGGGSVAKGAVGGGVLALLAVSALRKAGQEPRPELAAQIYAASLLAIKVDTQPEQQYLEQLASGLRLAPETVRHIEDILAHA